MLLLIGSGRADKPPVASSGATVRRRGRTPRLRMPRSSALLIGEEFGQPLGAAAGQPGPVRVADEPRRDGDGGGEQQSPAELGVAEFTAVVAAAQDVPQQQA